MSDTSDSGAKLPPPFLLRRLMAMLYDTLLVLPIIMFNVAIALGLQGALMSASGGSTEELALPPLAVQGIALLTVIGFFSIFWIKSGQTLGMQAWRIKLVRCDGGNVSLYDCVVRCLGALLSALCLGLGYVWCLFDSEKRSWHDRLSKTELHLLPKRKSGKNVAAENDD
ncbi:MAG: RDD family protein [Halieaceae bacterium]